MGFQKFFPILALSILVLYQAGSLHAVPFSSTLESSPDLTTLSEEEARLLLAALVQDYLQMKASELHREQETEDSSLDSPRSKRCGNLSTCMLGTYTQDLNKFHTFPQTAIGVGAPGKKRDMTSDLETEHRPHCHCPEESLQHCHLCEPAAGRIAEQIRGCVDSQVLSGPDFLQSELPSTLNPQ
ncbi:calcitonin-like [Callospermophilus lateralis]|uniref:calcitonin-like n=1 Tax=Callospermophilus lateralis TaxID=76772 RepID=UPI00405461B9